MTYSPKRNYVKVIVRKFGTASHMAKVLDIPKTTIYSWIEAGFIPQKYHEVVYIFGQTFDPPIQVEDFICFDIDVARERAIELIDSLAEHPS